MMRDLVAASRDHLAFLRAVHLCERDLYHSKSDLMQAVTVYTSCWLPSLKGCHDAARFSPPHLDVAWVWHLHKTDPTSYERDCCSWYGKVLDVPSGISPFCHLSELSPLPAACDSATEKCICVEGDFFERISVSARNQSKFLWHTRWPEYDGTVFLEESVTRYQMMLRLMKENPAQFIVPTYDIDNIWHTHLAFPCRYIKDCCRIVGRSIHHDDDVGNDRSATSFLKASTIKTEELWQSTFGTPWKKEGCMHRGEPPAWYWANRFRAATPAWPIAQAADKPILTLRYAVEIFGHAFGTAGDSEETVTVSAPRPSLLRLARATGHGQIPLRIRCASLGRSHKCWLRRPPPSRRNQFAAR